MEWRLILLKSNFVHIFHAQKTMQIQGQGIMYKL